MEENSDNFFAGVIEFGDGHQYKIESTNNNQLDRASPPRAGVSNKLPSGPVSKEDRFMDDFHCGMNISQAWLTVLGGCRHDRSVSRTGETPFIVADFGIRDH